MRTLITLLFVQVVLSAQARTRIDEWVDDRVRDVKTRAALPGLKSPVADTFSTQFSTGAFATLLLDRELSNSTRDDKSLVNSVWNLADASLDRQVDAAATNAASTSLAMKGFAPGILGLAVDNGALLRDVSGTIVTFRTTPSMLARALERQPFPSVFKTGFLPTGEPAKVWGEWMDKFSFFASFDTSKDNTTNTLLANRRQLNSFGGRVQLFNQREVRQRKYYAMFQALADKSGPAFIAASARLKDALDHDPQFQAWLSKLRAQTASFESCLLSKSGNATEQEKCVDAPADGSPSLATVLKDALADFLKLSYGASSPMGEQLREFAVYVNPLLAGTATIRDYANKGLLATLDWTVSRDATLPDLSTITAVVEGGVGKGRKYDLTTNFASSFYFRRPAANIGQFHSFKGTGQFDIPLGSFAEYGPFVFSLAGRYEYIPNNTLSPATNLLADPASTTTPTTTPAAALAPTLQGNIWLGQAKLTIPIKGMPVKIPLSLTWANRTELIKEKEVRVSFGFTFDLDALIAKNAK